MVNISCLGLVLLSLWGSAVAAPATPPDSESLPNVLRELGITGGAADSFSRFSTPGGKLWGNPRLTCAALQTLLKDKITTPDGNNYKTLSEVNWTQRCWLYPACIVSPGSSADTAIALKAVSLLKTHFAIRSGGHSVNPGYSNTDSSGVLIALGSLNRVDLSPDKSIATVGAGNRWLGVYSKLALDGVTVIGGRVPAVGVGGLVLGGGLNYFSDEFGFAADGVARFEVVLSTGKIVSASQQENSDLFWALKGGSANFGIVTAFDLRTYPISNIFFEVRLYPTDQSDKLIEAIGEFVKKKDVKSTVSPQFRGDFNILVMTYTEPDAEKAKAAFTAFDGLLFTPLAPPTVGPYLTVVEAAAGGFSATPQRDYSRVTSFKQNTQFNKEWYPFYVEALKELPSNATLAFAFQQISPSMVSAGDKYGGNAMGIHKEQQVWLNFVVGWTNPADDKKMIEITLRLEKKITDLAKKRGLHLEYIFMNDGADDQKVLQSYGVQNLAKLKTVSKKYDVAQVFQKYQKDGFLLRNT